MPLKCSPSPLVLSAHFFQPGIRCEDKHQKAPTHTTSPFSCLLTSQQGPAKKRGEGPCDSLIKGVYSSKWRQRFQMQLCSHSLFLCKQAGSEYNGISDLPCFKCVILGPYLIYHDHLVYCVKDLLVTSPPIHVHGRAMYMAKLETVT